MRLLGSAEEGSSLAFGLCCRYLYAFLRGLKLFALLAAGLLLGTAKKAVLNLGNGPILLLARRFQVKKRL